MFDYESPVRVYLEEVQYKQEEAILQAIQKIGVNVDKGELIAALNYDRKQYEKGYWDGVEVERKNFDEFLQKLQAMLNEIRRNEK